MSKRSYLEKCSIQWREDWQTKPDGYKDNIGDWARKHSNIAARCMWCSTNIEFCNTGLGAFKQHARTKTHKSNADGRNNRLSNQASLLVERTAADAEEEDMGEPADEDDRREGDLPLLNQGRTGGRGGRDRGGGVSRRKVAKHDSVPRPNLLTLNDRVDYAETRLCLKMVESNWSFKSLENMQQVLISMDPASEILSKINVNRLKMSAMVGHGLFPHMKERLVLRIKRGWEDGGFFVAGVDASTIRHLGIQKHIDINVR